MTSSERESKLVAENALLKRQQVEQAEFIDRNLNPKKIKKTPQNRYLFNTLHEPSERLRQLNGAHRLV